MQLQNHCYKCASLQPLLVVLPLPLCCTGDASCCLLKTARVIATKTASVMNLIKEMMSRCALHSEQRNKTTIINQKRMLWSVADSHHATALDTDQCPPLLADYHEKQKRQFLHPILNQHNHEPTYRFLSMNTFVTNVLHENHPRWVIYLYGYLSCYLRQPLRRTHCAPHYLFGCMCLPAPSCNVAGM